VAPRERDEVFLRHILEAMIAERLGQVIEVARDVLRRDVEP
jgi:hypothetical protein